MLEVWKIWRDDNVVIVARLSYVISHFTATAGPCFLSPKHSGNPEDIGRVEFSEEKARQQEIC